MIKKRDVTIVVVIVALLAFGVWLGFYFAQPSRQETLSPYSAVYMSTGDIYFGKLSWFPWPEISNVWYLARGTNPSTQNPEFNVVPLKSVVWGPIDNKISLNPKEIVFWTRLSSDNRIAKAMEGQGGSQSDAGGQNSFVPAMPGQESGQPALPAASSSKK